AYELGALAKCPLRVALFFQPSWALRGGSQYFAPHAYDFDALVGLELPADGGPSQVGLSMQEACGRTSELSRDANDSYRVVSGAIVKIGGRGGRANKNQRRQPPEAPVYLPERLTVFDVGAFSPATRGRGVKTATW